MNPISTHECDILVIGSSLEGCVAAIEAARKGKKVLLIENSGSLGQASTNGLNIYLPKRDGSSLKVREYQDYILKNAGNGRKVFYHDQQLKIVLRRLLDEAGVQVLTHVFLVSPRIEQEKLVGFRICGKTGYIDVAAKVSIDATDKMEAGAAIGLATEVRSKRIKTSVKFNQVSTEAIRKIADTIIEEQEGCIIGSLNYFFTKANKSIYFSAENICLYHDVDYKELVITGLSAFVSDINVAALSAATSGLRSFAYELRDEFRKNEAGFEKANIITVAPRVDCYGVRKIVQNPYKNLILINNEVNEYNNLEAIALGLKVYDY